MAASIIGTVIQQIQAGQDPEESLRQLPIGQISWDNVETLINHFLEAAVDKPEAARSVIEVINDMRAHMDPLPTLTYLFLNCTVRPELLTFVVKVFSEKEPLQYYVDLVNLDTDAQVLQLVSNLAKFLPELSDYDWDLLLQLTEDTEEEEYRNQILRTFFQTKVAEMARKVVPPPWVVDLPKMPLSDPPTLPSVKEAVDLLIADIKTQMTATDKDGESIDIQHGSQIREALISQYAISTISEKIAMLSVVKPLPSFDSTNWFREFGPINTLYCVSTFHDPSHECAKYGGCTMFLCTEFEDIDVDGDDVDLMTVEEHLNEIDWFRGSCDRCVKRIPLRHYAVRFPLRHGGWKGCYCSFECMQHLAEDDGAKLMLSRMQDQLTTIGIRNR